MNVPQFCFRTIEAHTGGEPLRIVVDGFPAVPGATMLAKRRHAREYFDALRRALMFEPRGHADMYGAVLTEPVTPDGDRGVLFLHNEGWSTMCGHGVIALTKVLVERGLVATDDRSAAPVVRLDTPAGRVTATAHRDPDGVVRSVTFVNVPSFVLAADVRVDVPGFGDVRCDVAFGGAFYAFVDAADVGVELVPEQFGAIVAAGRAVKAAVTAQVRIEHPSRDPELEFVYGTILTGPGRDPAAHSRNVCVFADGEVDRSPTGTGVSARAAIHRARGELAVGEWIRIESLVGSAFDVRAVRDERIADGVLGVVPEVRGSAHVVGEATWWVDPEDPLRDGFLLR